MAVFVCAASASGDPPPPTSWWCHAGASTCFRSRDECANKHLEGRAGCEPRALAYCRDLDRSQCWGGLDVCTADENGYPTLKCVAVH